MVRDRPTISRMPPRQRCQQDSSIKPTSFIWSPPSVSAGYRKHKDRLDLACRRLSGSATNRAVPRVGLLPEGEPT